MRDNAEAGNSAKWISMVLILMLLTHHKKQGTLKIFIYLDSHFIIFSEISNLPGFTENNAHEKYFPEALQKVISNLKVG